MIKLVIFLELSIFLSPFDMMLQSGCDGKLSSDNC